MEMRKAIFLIPFLVGVVLLGASWSMTSSSLKVLETGRLRRSVFLVRGRGLHADEFELVQMDVRLSVV
jgi:hypothetical protein